MIVQRREFANYLRKNSGVKDHGLTGAWLWITRIRFVTQWQAAHCFVRNNARFFVEFFDFLCSIVVIPAVKKENSPRWTAVTKAS